MIDRVAELSDVRYPIMVLPTSIRRLTRIREAIGLPGALSAEASNLMGQDWRFTSKKARDELGYTSRPLDDTLNATIEWVLERIEAGAFDDRACRGCRGGPTRCAWPRGSGCSPRFGWGSA